MLTASRLILAGLAAAAAGCARPSSTAETSADARALAACRGRADEVYQQQNRGAVFTSIDNSSSPLSGSYVSGITSRGLGQQFGRDQMIDDCLRASGDSSPADAAATSSTGPAFTPNSPTAPGTRR